MVRKKRNIPHPEDDQIRAEYLEYPVKALAKRIGRSHCYLVNRLKVLGLVIPAELIEARKQATRLKPGNVPKNKGKRMEDYMTPEQIQRSAKARFPKGNLPHNTLQDGAISIRKDKRGVAYKFIRVSKGKWEYLQRYVWEQQNGPIPKDCILCCIDGDTLNCDPSNWELKTKKENAISHSASLRLTDGYVAFTLAGGPHKATQEVVEAYKENPELLDVKRLQMKLSRQIKHLKNDK